MARTVTVEEKAGIPHRVRIASGVNAAGQPIVEQWSFQTPEHAAKQRAQFAVEFTKAQRDQLAAVALGDA